MDSVGRFLGFLMFAGPAMLIFAALVLLPSIKHWKMMEYDAACKQNLTDQRNQALDSRSRVIHDLQENEVLTERLLMSQTSLTPANQTVVVDPSLPPWSPMMINPIKLPPPPPPQGKLLQLADKLENPTTKLGLLLVMIGAGLAAVFLYGPPATRKPIKDASETKDAPGRTAEGATLKIVNRQS
jgi:hypothetical protein